MPQMAGGTYLRNAPAVTLNVKVDLRNGTVKSAEAVSGHPLIRASAEAAARKAEFDPVLKEFRTIYATGTITYESAHFNTPSR